MGLTTEPVQHHQRLAISGARDGGLESNASTTSVVKDLPCGLGFAHDPQTRVRRLREALRRIRSTGALLRRAGLRADRLARTRAERSVQTVVEVQVPRDPGRWQPIDRFTMRDDGHGARSPVDILGRSDDAH
jgi:hypothetical protein